MRALLSETGPRWIVVALMATMLWPSVAAAGELEDFQEARQAYEEHRHARAVELLEAMVGGPAPRLRSRPLILESRKYLAASYLYLDRSADAEAQLELLLREDPGAVLDSATFPSEALRLFGAVRERLARARTDEEEARLRLAEEQAREEEALRAQRRERLVELLSVMEDDEVEVQLDPVVPFLPFGAGQFQNGNEELGITLLVSQALLGLTAAATLIAWVPLAAELNDPLPTRIIDEGSVYALQVVNWTSAAAFLALAVGGVIEALIHYSPTRTVRRPRRVPQELIDDLDLLVGPTGVTLRF